MRRMIETDSDYPLSETIVSSHLIRSSKTLLSTARSFIQKVAGNTS
jgi:hypothetical protein